MGILLTQREGAIIGNIAKLLGAIMNFIYEMLSKIGIENLGLCIILFTIIIYTLMLPMTIKQQKFSRLSAVMNPELQAIRKKYENKKDNESMMKMNEETKLVYAKYGTSPTGGCLGSLIQLPILFALWPVVQNIPAYVKGVKDVYMPLVNEIMASDGYQKIMEKIGTTSPINISPEKYDYQKSNTIVDVLYKFQSSTWDTLADKFPDISDMIYEVKESLSHMTYFLGINISETPTNMFNTGIKSGSVALIVAAIAIPLLAGVTQWLNAQISQYSSKKNSNGSGDEMMQQMNTMMKIMPLISVFFCFSMPAGLGIYWITSAVVRSVQQIVINKVLDKKPIEAIVEDNVQKVEKMNAKKKIVEPRTVNTMAQKNTRKIEEPKNDTDSYKTDAKPGSLASKANMVRDFNNRQK